MGGGGGGGGEVRACVRAAEGDWHALRSTVVSSKNTQVYNHAAVLTQREGWFVRSWWVENNTANINAKQKTVRAVLYYSELPNA